MFILTFLLSSVAVFAQGGVGSTRGLPDTSGGTNMLEGRVRLPNGRSVGQGIVVKLEGMMVSSRTTTTDLDGMFVFRSLPSGEYVLSVDGGADYQAIRQTVLIQGTAAGARVGQSMQVVSADLHFFPRPLSEEEITGVPQEALDSYKKGMEFARSGDSKKAVEQLKKAVEIHPTFTQGLRDLGTQYLKLNEMGNLATTMESLIKLSPKDPRAHLNLGIALYNQKKYPEAETHLRQAIELGGGDAAAHYYLGMTLVGTKQWSDAEKELEFSIKNGGDNLALAHKYLGGLYMSFKKNQQAADELEKYLKLDPKASDAERIKGTIKELRAKE
jgi:tetratricopeptide (TPR) repeat protein